MLGPIQKPTDTAWISKSWRKTIIQESGGYLSSRVCGPCFHQRVSCRAEMVLILPSCSEKGRWVCFKSSTVASTNPSNVPECLRQRSLNKGGKIDSIRGNNHSRRRHVNNPLPPRVRHVQTARMCHVRLAVMLARSTTGQSRLVNKPIDSGVD
jgi:hypothetical protein